MPSKIRLIKLTNGHRALVVNNVIVVTADPAYENPARVDATAKRLATAEGVNLEVTRYKGPLPRGWSWADVCQSVIGSDGGHLPQGRCHSCTAPLLADGYCSDDACPYANWPQAVALADLTAPAAEIEARYGFSHRQRIPFHIHAEDQTFQALADAVPWFRQAHDEDVIELAEGDWSYNHQADAIAWFLEPSVPGVGAVTTYSRNTQGSLKAVGFECDVDAEAAMRWLEVHRRAVWAQLMCAAHSIVLFQSDTAGSERLWGWASKSGDTCEPTFPEKAGAAVDAVEALHLSFPPTDKVS